MTNKGINAIIASVMGSVVNGGGGLCFSSLFFWKMGLNMIKKVINEKKLKKQEMERVVTRVKALMINSDNELLLGMSNGKYFFIGGHTEKKETLRKALCREIKEETGIILDKKPLLPFYKIERWEDNHFNTGKKTISQIYYYYIKDDQEPDISRQSLDWKEQKNHFHLVKIKENDFQEMIANEKNKGNALYQEMEEVFTYAKKRYRG